MASAVSFIKPTHIFCNFIFMLFSVTYNISPFFLFNTNFYKFSSKFSDYSVYFSYYYTSFYLLSLFILAN